MVERVTGAAPRVFRHPSVQLFRADERVFEGMLEGWRTQMLARGLEVSTIRPKLALVKQFQEFAETFPWQWSPVDFEQFASEPKANGEPRARSTVRMFAGSIGEFCSYTTNPAYGWVDYCEGTFGDVPSQIVFDWNSPHHTSDSAVPASRRALTRPELQTLFDHMDDAVDREYAAGSKRWMSLLRNSVAFKLCYAFGLRKRELAMLELVDFGPNPHVPAYGIHGALTVRWGKGAAGTQTISPTDYDSISKSAPRDSARSTNSPSSPRSLSPRKRSATPRPPSNDTLSTPAPPTPDTSPT